MQSLLSVPLGAVAMDAGAGITFTVQEVLQSISSFLRFHKDQSQGVFACETTRTDTLKENYQRTSSITKDNVPGKVADSLNQI